MPINGRYYDWEHISIQVKGVPLADVLSIDYEDSEKVNAIFGKGRTPRGYTKGNWEGSGKLTLLREEYDRLRAAAPEGNVYKLDPFDIVISYDKGNGTAVTDTLKDCLFTKRSFGGVEQDTERITVELEFVVLGEIQHG
uniref:Phage tail protein n=1 Tax=Thermus islandicus TaxID=540988 RepID=A0A7C2C4L8_9DEIN